MAPLEQPVTDRELFDSQMEAAKGAIQAAILINGAASVSLLTFSNSLLAAKVTLPVALLVSMALFTFGVLSSAVAAGIAYVTQTRYREAEWVRNDIDHWRIAVGRAKWWNGVAATLIIFSYGLFAMGSLCAGCGLWPHASS